MSKVLRIFLVLIVLTVVIGGAYWYYSRSLLGGEPKPLFSFKALAPDTSDKLKGEFHPNIIQAPDKAFDLKNVGRKDSDNSLATRQSSGGALGTPEAISSRDMSKVSEEGMGVDATMPAPAAPYDYANYNSIPYTFEVVGTLPEIPSEESVYKKEVSPEFQNSSVDLSGILNVRSQKLQNMTILDGDYSVNIDFTMGNLSIYRNYNDVRIMEEKQVQRQEDLISENEARKAAEAFLDRFGIATSDFQGPNIQAPQQWGGCPVGAMCLMREGDGSAGSTGVGEIAPTPSTNEPVPTEPDTKPVSDDVDVPDASATDPAVEKMIWPGPVGFGPYMITYTMDIDGRKVLNQWDRSSLPVVSISVNSTTGEVDNMYGWISALNFTKSNYPTLSSQEITALLEKGGMSGMSYWGIEKTLAPLKLTDFEMALVEYYDWQTQGAYYIPTLFASADNPYSQGEWDKKVNISIPLISREYLPFLPGDTGGGGVPIPLMEKAAPPSNY